ncbi:MAG: bifunctional 4-hydroxy-2-oxoglutarate aldolase/2-dehydro-3-deoxy-phosphogluconate aldolase [Candidatus Omnitrophota bacterium]
MNVPDFKKLPIMGILRGIDKTILRLLTETMISSGLKTVELAMNTKDAHLLIKDMVRLANKKLTIGAGTVLTKDDLKKALDSGASFIVMPIAKEDVVRECVKKNIPVFPGAFTPTEIYNAWSMGATMVKVFPAKFFGPSYLKEIKAPFNDILFLACGGVTPENIKEFFQNGASGAAFGGNIFKKQWMNKDNICFIEENIKNLIANFKESNR